MGYNRSGTRRTKRLKRRKKQEERLAAKRTGTAVGKPTPAGTPKQK
jgi:hypothetical protein